jgi:long-chain fatty acid transport protein
MKLTWKLALVLLLAPMICHAAGFALYDISAAGQAMAHAYICRVDDPSAVWYNPAALAGLEGTQLAVNSTWMHTDARFTPTGSDFTIQAVPQNLFPSNFFLSHQFNDGLTLGFGVYTPFAFRTEWPSGSAAASISRKAELRTLYLTPSVGFQLSPNVSVGGGFDFVYADTTLENESYLFGQLVSSRINADTTNVGFNLGVLIDTNSNLKLAATYKSKVDLDMDGDGRIAAFPSLSLSRSAQVSLPLPAQFMVGASTSYDRFVFEGDFVWTGWSRFQALGIDYHSHLVPDSTLLREWESRWSFRLGTEYRWSDELALRGGYSYDRSPEPLRSLDPILPDGQRQGLSAGFGWGDPKWGFDFGYTHLFFKNESSPVDSFAGPDAAGDYSNSHDLLSAGFTYRW